MNTPKRKCFCPGPKVLKSLRFHCTKIIKSQRIHEHSGEHCNDQYAFWWKGLWEINATALNQRKDGAKSLCLGPRLATQEMWPVSQRIYADQARFTSICDSLEVLFSIFGICNSDETQLWDRQQCAAIKG